MVVATANDNWQNSSENGAYRQTIAFLSAGPDKEQNQMASSFFGDRWLASLSSTVFGCLLTLLMTFGTVSAEEMKWVVYPPGDGPGKGRSIVLGIQNHDFVRNVLFQIDCSVQRATTRHGAA